ncbi:MAG: DNA helicase RecQ [Crocinitomicaceae bacterium]
MQQPQEVLKEVFGYDHFRLNQQEVIEHALAGQDGLAIMPTGGGKSICFQIPAILKPNTTLVISPLISLMKDQVDALKANGVETAFYNSSMNEAARKEIRAKALKNELKLLYMSPETLVAGMDWIRSVPVSMVAIDEAHCVSMWGHDFRPEYQQIGQLREHFPNVPFLAFTATADKITRLDITKKLSLQKPSTFISSFDRPNLSLSVRSQVPKKDKEKEITHFIRSRENEAGIIYCLSRKETESWSNFLNSNGISSRYYHAGLSSEDRDAIQDGFINDQFNVICATIAFGMGIDKSNIRWVIHNNLPKNIEGYYQEIGRAGRDGIASDTILYYNYRDVVLLNDFVKDSEYKEVYHEKINRMLKYAEATSCRRKILLAYFGEHLTKDCGNCDVCQGPPAFFDGKVLAQKAMSASLRSKESMGMNLLINVLRGAKTMDIMDRSLHKIKTYGAGADHSFKQWQHYVNQMINQGLFEIAYDDHMKLKVTEIGQAILSNQESFYLTEFQDKKLKKSKKKSVEGTTNDTLLTALKSWRLAIAKANHVPAYVILHDSSLIEIAKALPTSPKDLKEISGFGKVKIDRFGKDIIEIVLTEGRPSHLSTYETTYQLYQAGLDISKIAEKRKLKEPTIINHLVKLFEDGTPIDMFRFISEYELQEVKKVRAKIGQTHELKPIHDALEGELSYSKISIALAILNRHF